LNAAPNLTRRELGVALTNLEWCDKQISNLSNETVGTWGDLEGGPRPREHQGALRVLQEGLVFHCRRNSASTAPCTSRRMCFPTHCASYCAPCQPLLRAFPGWIREPRRPSHPAQRGEGFSTFRCRWMIHLHWICFLKLIMRCPYFVGQVLHHPASPTPLETSCPPRPAHVAQIGECSRLRDFAQIRCSDLRAFCHTIQGC